MIEALLGPLQRWLFYSGVLLLVGVATWRSLIGPAALSELADAGSPSATRAILGQVRDRITGIGYWVSVLLLPVWLLAFVVQLLGFRDPFAPLREDIGFLLSNTFWARVWAAQGLLIVGSVLALRRWKNGEITIVASDRYGASRWRSARTTRPGGGLFMVALPFTMALSSHAMAQTGGHRLLAVGADAVHALSAGAWIGSLALILTAGAPRQANGAPLASQLRAFSPVAKTAVGALVGMGLILSTYHLSSFRDLWSEPYGRILFGKILLAMCVLYLGFRNWRHGVPTLDSEAGREKVRRRAFLESGIAGAVLLSTAILTGTPTP